MKRKIAPYLLLLLGGCSSMETSAPPAVAALTHSSVSLPTLEEGRKVFTQACTSCHSAAPLSQHSLSEWQLIVESMAPRTRLDESRKTALMAYITAAKTL
jgi:mono/diheme cytochrome c family protein